MVHFNFATSFAKATEVKESQGGYSSLVIHSNASHRGFFFAGGTDELSNLKLVDDVFKIVEFIESEVPGM